MPEGRTTENITLGSGHLYMIEHTNVIPDISELFVTANRVGYTKGGASIEYSQTTYEEKDDEGYVCKVITTEEEAKLKCGLLTWNGTTIEKLVDRSKTASGRNGRITKIGGKGNEKGKYYVVGFMHEDKKDGNVYVIIVGRNVAGLIIAFSKDAGSVIEPEFKALPQDTDGTLILFIEQTDLANSPTLSIDALSKPKTKDSGAVEK